MCAHDLLVSILVVDKVGRGKYSTRKANETLEESESESLGQVRG